MSNIAQVDLILIKIFKCLPFEDRKTASVVCKKWHNILTGTKAFAKDVTLLLEYCIIGRNNPPWNVLRKSSRQFTHITIGLGIGYKNEGDLFAFLTDIGQNALTIDCGRLHTIFESPKLVTVFPHVHHVVLLKYEHIFCYDIPNTVVSIHIDTDEDMSAIQQYIPAKELKKIKEMTHLQRLTTGLIRYGNYSGYPDGVKFIKFSKRAMEFIAVNIKGIGVRISPTLNLLSTEEIELESLLYTIIDHDGKRNVMDMRNIYLKNTPTTMAVNIQPTIQHDNNPAVPHKCLFFHRPIDLQSVKAIRLFLHDDTKETCKECIENLRVNCTNLRFFDIVWLPENFPANIVLQCLGESVRKIKIGRFFSPNVNFSIVDCQNWPFLPQVSTITFQYCQISKRALEIIVTKIPNIKYADMGMSIDAIGKLRVVGDGWLSLKHLEVDMIHSRTFKTRDVINVLKGANKYPHIYSTALNPAFPMGKTIFYFHCFFVKNRLIVDGYYPLYYHTKGDIC